MRQLFGNGSSILKIATDLRKSRRRICFDILELPSKFFFGNFLFIENINKNRASPVYNLTGGSIYILQWPGPLQTHYDGGNEYSVVLESHLGNVDWTPKKRNGQLSQLELLLSQIVSIQVNFPLDSLSNIVLMKFHQVKLFFNPKAVNCVQSVSGYFRNHNRDDGNFILERNLIPTT